LEKTILEKNDQMIINEQRCSTKYDCLMKDVAAACGFQGNGFGALAFIETVSF